MTTLKELRMQRDKLMVLAKKQRINNAKMKLQKMKEMKIKREIQALRLETSKKAKAFATAKRVVSGTKRIPKSERVKKAKKFLKGIDSLIRKIPS